MRVDFSLNISALRQASLQKQQELLKKQGLDQVEKVAQNFFSKVGNNYSTDCGMVCGVSVPCTAD